MSKKQEIELLKETIARLGPDSYCGPWLAGQFGAIESALDSDYPPEAYALNPSQAIALAQARMAEAKRDAEEIRDNARKEAERVKKDAADWRDQIRAMVRRDLEAILRKI